MTDSWIYVDGKLMSHCRAEEYALAGALEELYIKSSLEIDDEMIPEESLKSFSSDELLILLTRYYPVEMITIKQKIIDNKSAEKQRKDLERVLYR